MYSEWNSLFSTVSENSSGSQSHSVLRKFDREIGKSVTQSVVKELAVSLGITQAAVPSALTQVNEVIDPCTRNYELLYSFYCCYFRSNGVWMSFVLAYHCHLVSMKQLKIVLISTATG